MRAKLRAMILGNLVPTVVFGAVLVLALVYLDELRAWMSLARPTERAAASSAATTSGGAVAPYTFSDPSAGALRAVFGDYEQVRALLAQDEQRGLDAHGRSIAEGLRQVGAGLEGAPKSVSRTLLDGGAAAERLAVAPDLTQARSAFGDLSRALVALSSADPRLQEGMHIFECPMEKGYNKWLQPTEELANPYMGRSMLQCGGASEFAAAARSGAVSHEGHGHEGDDVAYFTCPMHPSVKEAAMGQCPICGMDLTPVTFDEEEGGVVLVDSVRRQRIGVKVGKAEVVPMTRRIRTVGRLTYDETKLHDITLKYKGWIEKLYANKLGMRVKRGAPLFAVYSPEIYAAQGDLITALEGPSLFASDEGDGENRLVEMARERLRLFDAYGLERHVKRTGRPVRYITVAAPTTGYVVEKNVVDGSAFAAGARVMRIAGLDTVWIDAELYEADLPLVAVGQRAQISLTHQSNKTFEGEITYLYPYLDPKTRTGKARVELKNDKLELKPDMYANVVIDVELGERLTVPESAVIYTGTRRLVFVDLGEGRLMPKEVELGLHAERRYEVRSGLRAGEAVVVSGNFLVAAESRIRSAARYWGADDGPSPLPERP